MFVHNHDFEGQTSVDRECERRENLSVGGGEVGTDLVNDLPVLPDSKNILVPSIAVAVSQLKSVISLGEASEVRVYGGGLFKENL